MSRTPWPPASLELGGRGATVVFSDADLDAAVEITARAVFNNSGQVYLCTSRVHVHRSVYEEFVARLVQKATSLTIGDSMQPGTDLGPLASERHAAKVSGYFDLITAEGGEVLTGGPADGRAGTAWVNYYQVGTAVLRSAVPVTRGSAGNLARSDASSSPSRSPRRWRWSRPRTLARPATRASDDVGGRAT